MKNVASYFIVTAAIVLAFTSCTNRSGTNKLTKADSANVFYAYRNENSIGGIFKSDEEKRVPITITQARDFASDYYDGNDKLPIITMTAQHEQKWVKAFVIDSATIELLRTNVGAANFKGIRAYFGVNGRDANDKPLYTLILVSMKKLGDNDEEDHIKDREIYDYVLPCPENCPKVGTRLH